MAQTPPPGIDPVPTPPIQRGDRATFSSRVDAFILWLVAAVTQFQAVASNVYANALDAFASATSALGYRDAAIAARDAAIAARDLAQGYRDTAQAAATAAAASATALVATSASSNTVGTGTKVFAVGTGKQFQAGIPVTVVDASNPANAMYGTVASYTGGNLTVTVTSYDGGGTLTNWNISVSGQRGPAGAAGGVTGGNLSGGLWAKRGTDTASASTPDIWAAGGNFIVVTGTASITGFAPAPQAGATMTILAGAAFSMVDSANLVIKGGSFTAAVGDEIDVEAETTTKFRVSRRRADGLAAAQPLEFQNATMLEATGVFVPTVTGLYEITLAGAAGRGGSVAMASGSLTAAYATGAGGPGFCRARRLLTAGTSYMFTAGNGVISAVNPTFTGGLLQGVDGGDSTFSGADIATMTAGGGKAGAAAATGPLSGGAGGTASGGDLNYTGGRGGNITGNVASTRAATGGGALNITGTPRNGGDITASGVVVATGGASPGGNGGNATAGGASGGGGVGGSAPNISTAVAGAGGAATRQFIGNLLNIFSAGTAGVLAGAASSPSDGGGSGGKMDPGGGTPSVKGGLMAGSGGFVQTDSTGTVNTAAGAGGDLGGASGGSIRYATSGGSTATGGATDDGWCLIRRT